MRKRLSPCLRVACQRQTPSSLREGNLINRITRCINRAVNFTQVCEQPESRRRQQQVVETELHKESLSRPLCVSFQSSPDKQAALRVIRFSVPAAAAGQRRRRGDISEKKQQQQNKRLRDQRLAELFEAVLDKNRAGRAKLWKA